MLRVLFISRGEEVLERVRATKGNLNLINAEKAFCEDLK
jgi:hypothetical protein